MTPDQLNQVHLTWCLDLLQRIRQTIRDPSISVEDKLVAAEWYAKQGLKVEREE